MRITKSIIVMLLALVMILSPLVQPVVVDAANVNDTNGVLELTYRYGANNLIQFNTNLPSDTPLVNFTASDNGCNIDETGNTVQWVGWIQMGNADGTIVLTFHYNAAFTAGQSYVMPAGAIFGFTDGKTYMLDKNYTLTFDGASWSLNAENPSVSFDYRYGTNKLIQFNTNLPTDTVTANWDENALEGTFLLSDSGSVVDQSANPYQQCGFAALKHLKDESKMVLTLNFNEAFEIGQRYILPEGAVFGFHNGIKYTLDRAYTLYWDGYNWTEDPVISLHTCTGSASQLTVQSYLPVSTAVANFLAADNDCKLLQSGDQQVGWIGMKNNGSISFDFNFNREFSAGESYMLKAGSVFGFTDGTSYTLSKTHLFTWNGTQWELTLLEPEITLSFRYGTNNLIQYNTNLPASTPIADFLNGQNGTSLIQSGDQSVGWIQMDNVDGTIVLTFHFNSAFEYGQSYTLSNGTLFGFTNNTLYQMYQDVTYYWDGSTWTTTQPHIHSYTAVVTAPTCTQKGYTTYTCACSDSYVSDEVAALGHDYVGTASYVNKVPTITHDCSRCDAVQTIELDFYGSTVYMGNTLAVYYYTESNIDGIKLSETETLPGFTNISVNFSYGARVDENSLNVSIGDAITNDDAYYKFPCRYITPSQIGDDITAVISGTFGEDTFTFTMEGYSVKKYCLNRISADNSTEEEQKMLVDMLYYCDASRAYTTYKADESVTGSLTAYASAHAERVAAVKYDNVLNAAYVDITDEKATWAAAAIELYDCVRIRLRFEAAEGVDAKSLTAKAIVDGETMEAYVVEKDGAWYVYVVDLAYAQLSVPVYVTLYEGDTAVSDTICYSVESYAATMLDNTNEKLITLLKAMMCYGDSAKAYFDTKNA